MEAEAVCGRETGGNVASGKSDSEAELGPAPQCWVRISLQPAVATGESFWSPRRLPGGGGRCHLAGGGRTEARKLLACLAQCGACVPVSCLLVLWLPASLALHLGPGLT